MDIPHLKPKFQTLHAGTVVPTPECQFVDFKYVIETVCHHASVSLLTGCGKSLYYAIFPEVLMGAVSRSIVIVSLPLITKST